MSERKCDVEVFSRVTGFFRPVQSWNKGKAAEFADRKKYNIGALACELTDDNSRVAETVAR